VVVEVDHNFEYQVIEVYSVDVVFVQFVDKCWIWVDDIFAVVEVASVVVVVDHNMVVVEQDEREEYYHHYNYYHNFVVRMVDQY
jgi:hypothetical protein